MINLKTVLVLLAIALLTGCSFDLPPDKTLKICESPKAISTVADAANPRKFTFTFTGTLTDIKGSITWGITGDDKSPDPIVAGIPTTTYTNVFSKGGSFTVTATGTTLCDEKINLSTTITVKACEVPTEITVTPDVANPSKYNFTLNGVLKDITITDWQIFRNGTVLETASIRANNPSDFNYTYTSTSDGTYTASATITTQCGDKKTLTSNFTVSIIASIANMMVAIPAGTFQMGDLYNSGDPNQLPVHSVTLSAFKMSKYEVSQAQWQAVMGSNPSYFNTCPTCSVEMADWDDVQVFITKLNTLTGSRYRLPTEAEWEYAAREGGRKVRFGNGKDILNPAEANFDGSANYVQPYSIAGIYRQKTTPVGSFIPNALGLYDMTGNVWEWCSDWYGGYSSQPETNPTGPVAGFYRVLRGGNWETNPRFSQVAYRHFNFGPPFRLDGVGFRLVSPQ